MPLNPCGSHSARVGFLPALEDIHPSVNAARKSACVTSNGGAAWLT